MSDDNLIPHYPIFLDLHGRLVIIVGGDEAAERKVTSLQRYGADICVISPQPSRRLLEMEAEGSISVEAREYRSTDIAGAALVICAGVPNELGVLVSRDAAARGCPVNVVGDAEHCSFLVPSSVRRGPLQFAVSTRGAAPAVAKRLRKELQERYGDEWGTYVTLLGEVRARAVESIDDSEQRDLVLARIADADLLERIASGTTPDADDLLEEFASCADSDALPFPPATNEP